MPKAQHMIGWSDYAGLFDPLPYTIVIGRGAAARKSLREFACDTDAIRWAASGLGRQPERVRLYRGRQVRGKPMMEIREPKT